MIIFSRKPHGPVGETQHFRKPPFIQWSFLVPLIGGRYHTIPELAIYKWYISGIFPANGVIIYHLPPIKATQSSYWFMKVTRFFTFTIYPIHWVSRFSGMVLPEVVEHPYLGQHLKMFLICQQYILGISYLRQKWNILPEDIFVTFTYQVVVSSMCFYYPYLGQMIQFDNCCQLGWKHQLETKFRICSTKEMVDRNWL